MSETDADKGTRWSNEIAQKIDRVFFAIVCLSGNNQAAPWVNFESGAVSKLGGRVATVCLDLRKSDVLYPLGLFQATDLTSKEDVGRLISSINAACLDRGVETDRLGTYFERWWPDLEAKIAELRDLRDDDEPVRRQSEDLLEEILEHVRAPDAPASPPPFTHGYLRQPYPVGDACQIVSGLDFSQRFASHNRVSLVVEADALKPWQTVALGALAEASKSMIIVTNTSGILLFTSETFPSESSSEEGST